MDPINIFGVYRNELTDRLALEVLHSSQIASGRYVDLFAQQFGQIAHQSHVVTVNDMSNAIQISLRLAGVSPGDEVATTSFACMSTNSPIATSGAVPLWIDIDPLTGLMDPDSLAARINSKTKAVLLYHLAGYPANAEKIAAICKKNGAILIEDCDNALLATINGKQVGTFGDFSIYSFYPNRQVNAGEGGALGCRRQEDAQRATKLRRYGIDTTNFRDKSGEINGDCDVSEIGWAATLNNLCSAIGYSQLDSVDNRIARARKIAEHYANSIIRSARLEIVEPIAGSSPAYWVFLIRARNRDTLLLEMKKRGINATKLHHLTHCYSGFPHAPAYLPNTQKFFSEVLAIPCGWWLSDDDVTKVVSTLTQLADH
jgi:perosamine synthetase